MRDPRWKVLYLLGVAVAAVASSRPAVLLGLLGLQVGLWAILRLPVRGLGRTLRRILVLVLFILLSYAFFYRGGAEDRTTALTLGALHLTLSWTGLLVGLLRSSRILTVILAAQVVRLAGPGDAFVRGLVAFRLPRPLAAGLDLLLASLASRPDAGAAGAGSRPRFELRRLLRGDVSALAELAAARIREVRSDAALEAFSPSQANDLAVITGAAVVAMSLRFLQVLPGLPVAPGHKVVVLLPLYILAASLTRSRWGATQTGLLVGIAGFLAGMGKLGPFDILRHTAPALFVDLSLPLARAGSRSPGRLAYGLIGLGGALTRLTAFAATAALAEAPPAFYTVLLPAAISNALFGMLSGFVTFPLLRLARRARLAAEAPAPIRAPEPAAGDEEPEREARP